MFLGGRLAKNSLALTPFMILSLETKLSLLTTLSPGSLNHGHHGYSTSKIWGDYKAHGTWGNGRSEERPGPSR